MNFSRKHVIIAVVTLVALGLIGYAVYLWQAEAGKYSGLVLWDETGLTAESRAYYEQQLSTASAAIEASAEAGAEIDWDLYLSAAWNAAAMGDLVQAREIYEEYFKLNQINPAAWNSYGSVLMRMEDYKTAEKAFRTAAELQPTEEFYRDWVVAINNLAPVGERDDEIKVILEDGVQRVGQSPWFMTQLAQWYLRHEECDKAIDHYEVAQTLLPDGNEAIQQDIAAAKAQCQD